MPDFTDALEHLGGLSEQLNAKTDDLTSDIKRLEKSLYKMRVGVSVWLDELIGAGDDTYQLGYTKLKDKWRIAIAKASTKKKGGKTVVEHKEEPESLLKAPRLIRVHALGKLDALLEALTERVSFFLSELDAARAALEPEPEPEPEPAAEPKAIADVGLSITAGEAAAQPV